MNHSDELTRALEGALTSAFAEIVWWHETFGTSLRERLEVAGITGTHREQLEAIWERAIATQQNVLLYLDGTPIRHGSPASRRAYPAATGRLTNPLPLTQLARLTTKELRQIASACSQCESDCDWALRTLRTMAGPTDYWLGADSPTYAFTRYRDWFWRLRCACQPEPRRRREPRPAPATRERSDGRGHSDRRHN